MTDETVSPKRKSMVIAYLLWVFLGVLAAHRFYLREKGWIQLVTVILFGVGIFWVVADLFLIPGIVKKKNEGEL
ncbi:TM2 domain-containing protein [Marinicauda algicola]|uniref:TM2 domain-containing protein n=1 Tax=Marinicauda algicola TaxID=2029849 RepID=A0A4S2H152_9PROT|nr:TM2 domain-containing protein [Marinicauda algicola]TGY89255.1 TM2 domain-containing protein [Marinicauda algicola]